MGVEIEQPSISPQPHTHLAFEGYQYAREHSKASEYNDRILPGLQSKENLEREISAVVKGDSQE